LIALLDVLEFRSNNATHRPVIDALALITRYAKAGNLTYYRSARRCHPTEERSGTGRTWSTGPTPVAGPG
jgi:hypothetical protein